VRRAADGQEFRQALHDRQHNHLIDRHVGGKREWYLIFAPRGADDRCLSSANRARTWQATKNDGLPQSF
jgi:hypothetical protein